jgi:hypothetical protein
MIVRSAMSSRPLFEVIAEAVAWGAVEGIPLKLNNLTGHGVVCTSTHGRVLWERDRRQPGCDPIGMAILKAQPQATLIPEAAAEALGVSIPNAEGLAEGLAALEPSTAWDRSIVRHRFLAGYEAGVLLRMAILSRDCPKHGRYELSALTCPLCSAEGMAKLERIVGRGNA